MVQRIKEVQTKTQEMQDQIRNQLTANNNLVDENTHLAAENARLLSDASVEEMQDQREEIVRLKQKLAEQQDASDVTHAEIDLLQQLMDADPDHTAQKLKTCESEQKKLEAQLHALHNAMAAGVDVHEQEKLLRVCEELLQTTPGVLQEEGKLKKQHALRLRLVF
jgi:Mg2+ and Co2+ transporter CorA